MQDDQYWEQFRLQPADLEHLANHLVESERPLSLDEMAREIVSHRHEQMLNVLRTALSQGRIYRPGEMYEVGERLLFPYLNNFTGQVVTVRQGHNPEYEPFSVIQVRSDEGVAKEFVAGFPQAHPLDTASYMPSGVVDVDSIYEQYGQAIRESLRKALSAGKQLVRVGEKWFLRELLMEIPEGQLNIAEAILDMAGGGPVRTAQLLDEMELPTEVGRSLQEFSLEYALLEDRRFDEVGPAGYALWYLRAMEPRQVLETPAPLRYVPQSYNRELLDGVALALETQVDDEWSEFATVPEATDSATIVLSYPHWRAGTLPLAPRVAGLFPTSRVTDRIRFTFVDGESGAEFPGWVVRSGRYVYGLSEWYAAHEVGVGTYIDLSRDREPGMIGIQVRRIRSKRREWLRTVAAEDGRFVFEVTRVPVSCEFDELATVSVADPAAVDALGELYRRVPLEHLLEMIFSGLAGLSLQRAVHAATLYSVVNLLRRVPPAPLLAALVSSQQYTSLGDNYWAYKGGD